MKNYLLILAILLLCVALLGDEPPRPPLVNDIIALKTNGVSDAVILAYVKAQAPRPVVKQPAKIDPEGYEFFWRQHLLPRMDAHRRVYFARVAQR